MNLGRNALLASVVAVIACGGGEAARQKESSSNAPVAAIAPTSIATVASPVTETEATVTPTSSATPPSATASPDDGGSLVLVAPARSPAGPSADTPSDDDPRTSSDIRAVLLAAKPKLRSCYLTALQRDPTLAFTLHPRVVVTPSGKVKEASFADPASVIAKTDATLRQCVLRVLKALTFRRAWNETVFQFPIVEHPQ